MKGLQSDLPTYYLDLLEVLRGQEIKLIYTVSSLENYGSYSDSEAIVGLNVVI